MKCEYCGNQNYDGEKKCEGCGATLPEETKRWGGQHFSIDSDLTGLGMCCSTNWIEDES